MGNTLPPQSFYRGWIHPLLAPIPDGAKTLWSLIAAHCWDGKPFTADSSGDADRYFAALMKTERRTATTERTIRNYRAALVAHGFIQERVHESSRKVDFIPIGMTNAESTQPDLTEEVGKNFPSQPKEKEEGGSSSIYTSSFNTNTTKTQNLRSKVGKNFPKTRKKFSNLPLSDGKNFPTSPPSRPEFGKKIPTSSDLSTPTPTPVDNPVDMSDLSTIEREMIERLDAIGIYGTYARSAIKKAVGSNLTPDDLIAYAQTVLAQCRNAREPGSAAGWRLANRPLKRLTLADQRAHDRDADTKRRFAEELE